MALKQAAGQLGQHPGNMLRAAVAGQQLGNQRRNAQIQGAVNALGMLLGAWEAQGKRKRQAQRDAVADDQFDRELALRLREMARKEKWDEETLLQKGKEVGLAEKYFGIASDKAKREGLFADQANPLRLAIMQGEADVAAGSGARADERHTADMLGMDANRGLVDAQTQAAKQSAMNLADERSFAQQARPFQLESLSLDPRMKEAGIAETKARTRNIRADTAAIPERLSMQAKELGLSEESVAFELRKWNDMVDDRRRARDIADAQLEGINADTKLTEARTAALSLEAKAQAQLVNAEDMSETLSSITDHIEHLQNLQGRLFGTEAGWGDWKQGGDEERDKYRAEIAGQIAAYQEIRKGLVNGEHTSLGMTPMEYAFSQADTMGAVPEEEGVFGEKF